jgi:predicted hotdog family 3-hydroxylacyl-ACP dehydratase
MRFSIDEILIHRSPIRMVDDLTDASESGATAEMTFHPNDYGVEDGVVGEPALLECMAQAMAAYQGHMALEHGVAPRPGMLVGIRDAAFHAPISCGALLRIRVQIKHRVGDFAIAECAALDGVRVCAQATLKFYAPGPLS